MMGTYPPGVKVLRVLRETGEVEEEVYPARTYYEGRGDHKGMLCERWNGPSGPRSRELGTACVGAFVPYPESEVQTDPWAEILEVVRRLTEDLKTGQR